MRKRAAIAAGALLVATLVAGAIAVMVAGAAGGQDGVGAVVGTGHLPARQRGSFVSLWPACGCANRTVLEQFSLRDGRRMGAVDRVLAPFPLGVGSPHADRHGGLWLTFGRGPSCGNDTAGCGPVENSCAGKVVRFDPMSGSSTRVLTFPSSEKVIDAVPSPDGSRVALVTGDCAHSFFNFHLVVRGLRSGRQWTLGADAAACHSLFGVAWSPDGSQLVFPYGPSKLAPGNRFQPEGACGEPRPSGLVVASSGGASSSSSWPLIAADPGCSYQAATFDSWGIAAIEVCAQGARPGTPSGVRLGNAYLVQLNRRHREVLRLNLARGYDGGGIAADPLDRAVLVSEYQAANQGVPVFNWVWTFDGRRLRVVRRYPNNDAPTVTAEPWVSGTSGREADVSSAPAMQLTQHYTDSAGWSFAYPATTQLERSGAAMLASFSEVTVANLKQRRAVHSGRTRDGGFIYVDPPLNESGKFPVDGVAFRMVLVEGGPAPDVTAPVRAFRSALAPSVAVCSTARPQMSRDQCCERSTQTASTTRRSRRSVAMPHCSSAKRSKQ